MAEIVGYSCPRHLVRITLFLRDMHPLHNTHAGGLEVKGRAPRAG